MPFTIGGITIPSPKKDYGISEFFGGNKASTNIQRQSEILQPTAMKSVSLAPYQPNASYAPATPKILGSKDISSGGSSSSSKSSGSSSKSSSSSKSDSQREYEAQSREVDNIYADIMDYIAKQRGNLNSSKGDLMKIASSPYDAVVPKIQESATQGINTLRGNITSAQGMGENALDSARRLYGELGTRNQQLFGSGALSSAGQASSELLSRDQARQFGDIRSQVANQVSTIENEIARVGRERDVKLNEVETQKQQAIAQAELNFRDRMAQIDQMEYQTKSNKKVEKINLLREYRQNVADTNKYYREVQSQVAGQSQVDLSNLQSMYDETVNSFNSSISNAQSGLDNTGNYLDQVSEEPAMNNAVTYNASGSMYPQLSGKRKPVEDYLNSDLYGSA